MSAPYFVHITVTASNSEGVLTTMDIDYPGSLPTKADLMRVQRAVYMGLGEALLALGEADVAAGEGAPVSRVRR